MRHDPAKLLYISTYIEHPPAGGPQLRADTSIKALSQICDLHVCQAGYFPFNHYKQTKAFYKRICHQFMALPSVDWENSKRIRFKHFLHKLTRSIRQERESSKADAAFIVNYARKHSVSTLWFGHATAGLYRLMKVITKLNPRMGIVCDTDSVMSQFIRRGLPYVRSELQRLEIEREAADKEAEERDWIYCSHVITAVSDVDTNYYRRLSECTEKIHRFSNVIDPSTYQNIPPPAHNLQKPCLCLAGSFFGSQSPMEDGSRWLIEAILPLVRQQIPDVHLYIVGRGSDRVLADIEDQGITITGQLPSVLSYLCHADVALVPLRFESGTRFKILEAGACGVPVVSTTLGAEGLFVAHERDILIADQPEPFAEAVVRLLRYPDLASEIAKNLKSLVYEKYSLRTLVEEGCLILEYLKDGLLSDRAQNV